MSIVTCRICLRTKGIKIIKKPFVVEPKVVNPLVHIVDVNITITKRKVIKKQVFKDKKPIKKKFVVGWEKNKNYNNLLSKQYKRCK
jgi:hypothetical protein